MDELYIFDNAIGPDVVASLFTSNQVPEPASLNLEAIRKVILR